MSTGAGSGTTTMAGGSGSAGSDGSAGTLRAADAEACASRSYQVQQLAVRVAACSDRADALLARLAGVELRSWESPAGRAYRTALSRQAASLRRSRSALQDAVPVVLRHARNVALSSGRAGP